MNRAVEKHLKKCTVGAHMAVILFQILAGYVFFGPTFIIIFIFFHQNATVNYGLVLFYEVTIRTNGTGCNDLI